MKNLADIFANRPIPHSPEKPKRKTNEYWAKAEEIAKSIGNDKVNDIRRIAGELKKNEPMVMRALAEIKSRSDIKNKMGYLIKLLKIYKAQ